MEEFNLKKGIKGEKAKTIEYQDTAAAYGSGLVEVFATPAMVAFMENTCLESVEGYLPEHYSTVGISISTTHEKATPAGMKVYCYSELIDIDRKKLTFSVTAKDEEGIIGKCRHERFIIDKDSFMEKLKK